MSSCEECTSRKKSRRSAAQDTVAEGRQDSGNECEKLIFDTLERDLALGPLNDEKRKTAKKSLHDLGLWPCPAKGSSETKIFADSIHGNMEVHPVCVAVINTPEFQRLRSLKQLGLCYFVYPAASHNRFEHSLGVSYLAGQFVRQLKKNQPTLPINNKDILCLELAGLCHDLGHGPFSHVFDHKFVKQCTDISADRRKHWKHEDASKHLFTYIYDHHEEVRKIFEEYDLNPTDREFIKELMLGANLDDNETKLQGRTDSNKAFLYEIVANHNTSIDVDKWDYLIRDCHLLGFQNNFDYKRFMKYSRVIEKDGKMRLAIRDKEIMNLYSLFSTRYILHKFAYQHKVVCALDIMVAQALMKANAHVTILNRLRVSDIIEELSWKGYARLTDNILYKILETPGEAEELKEAKEIIERIYKRDLYKCVAEMGPFKPEVLKSKDKNKKDEKNADIEKRILEEILKEINSANIDVIKKKIFVQLVDLDFGMKNKNPLANMCVYSKDKPNEATKLKGKEISQILMQGAFKEQLVRIYVTDTNLKDRIKKAADQFFDKNYKESSSCCCAACKCGCREGSDEGDEDDTEHSG